MFQGEVFWVVSPCSVAVGHQRFGGPSCHPEDGGSMVFLNISILPQHYTATQSGRLRLETPSPWRWRQHSPPKRCYSTTLHGVTTRRPRLEVLYWFPHYVNGNGEDRFTFNPGTILGRFCCMLVTGRFINHIKYKIKISILLNIFKRLFLAPSCSKIHRWSRR